MQDKIGVIIIDDEKLARDLVRSYLSEYQDIEILCECENGFEGLKAIQELRPQLIFLDIQMPKIDGFELLDVLDERPEIIFTTAFDQYAIKAFEMNAIDYLLKPFSKERLVKALEKAKQRIGTPSASWRTPSLLKHLDENRQVLERVITRLGSKITVIPVEKIIYLEAADDYVTICSDQGRHLKEKTMKYFEAHLPKDQFIRIHRGYIVNINEIKSLELYSKDSYLAILRNGERLKVSAEGYKRLREKF
jgi:two-component system, LytTR family, response regulator